MRVRVRFRFNATTGEVEHFIVDDLHEGPALADHDARHDRAAAEVARVVEANALVEELAPGSTAEPGAITRSSEQQERPQSREARRRGEAG